MAKSPKQQDSSPTTAADKRAAKLAEALRANLAKRKAQARARRAGEADQRADGLAAARTKP